MYVQIMDRDNAQKWLGRGIIPGRAAGQTEDQNQKQDKGRQQPLMIFLGDSLFDPGEDFPEFGQNYLLKLGKKCVFHINTSTTQIYKLMH